MIFYFTATGNSFFAVEKLRSKNETIVSIAQSLRNSNYAFDATHEQSIGFVFPVYFFGIPNAVVEFIQRLELKLPQNPYIYLVLTCGGAAGQTGRLFEQALATKEIPLFAQFAVKMPDTYIPLFTVPSVEQQQQILKRANADLLDIQKQICRQVKGDYIRCKGPLPTLVTKLIYPRYNKSRNTKKFRVSDSCDGCGLCASICPEEAIALQEKRPTWVKNQCSLCLACVHRCPKQAIDFGSGTRNKIRYLNDALSREKQALSGNQ